MYFLGIMIGVLMVICGDSVVWFFLSLMLLVLVVRIVFLSIDW